ncbi:hypothetical protein PC120_g19652 [Phytophthora cactorum]|nr:hypothetical protein PC120_g19652 [Phytophthora cactorum]
MIEPSLAHPRVPVAAATTATKINLELPESLMMSRKVPTVLSQVTNWLRCRRPEPRGFIGSLAIAITGSSLLGTSLLGLSQTSRIRLSFKWIGIFYPSVSPSLRNSCFLVATPPPPLEQHDDLIDEDHVCVLEDAVPWDVLTILADPLTFEDGGWFATSFVPTRPTKASITALIGIPLTPSRSVSPNVARAATRPDSIPTASSVDPGLELAGKCSSSCGEAGVWYPGLEEGTDPADLLEALAITDSADRASDGQVHGFYRLVPGRP